MALATERAKLRRESLINNLNQNTILLSHFLEAFDNVIKPPDMG